MKSIGKRVPDVIIKLVLSLEIILWNDIIGFKHKNWYSNYYIIGLSSCTISPKLQTS